MEQDGSTLKPSGIRGKDASGVERVPGLMRLFAPGKAMAVALPLRGGELELGRGSPALGEAQDPRMSRRHARIHFDGRRFQVTDLGSQNGTFVDGEPIPAETPREVQRVIRMGDSLFVPCADVNPLEQLGVVTRSGFVRGPAVQALLEEVSRAARLGFPLHIHGESGTGKEGVARAFHENGPRSTGPFVAVNCAAIPQTIAERLLFGAKRGAYSGAEADAQGYLQAADGGTLFLDEVVELDLSVQAKLLRALETKEVLSLGAAKPKVVDILICSASNKDLRGLVAGGKLREDLYFRIGRPEVTLPPLRQRPEELALLIQREVQQVAPELGLHISLVEACLLRPWPGNVRELLVETRSAVQAALMQGAQRVEARHLSPNAGTAFSTAAHAPPAPEERTPPRETPSRARPIDSDERARIEEALRQQGGNVAATARALGMHRTQLRRLLERHAIAIPAGNEPD
ncbi:sigma 54-interacting transcriptional regulator [Vitiosangium sp. GDMCC 1.1324]|uniref:sigma 54-interacting transcriptional regulator n=1 Tax=Vitiosangium sp. (strain GDMCC 1.1324) TaxID=2138576 RepID=UPI000D3904DF|nr:sigma 54-interacting transcriptional regulator [Vitiosangium sp. GDMCC 1.1324]PTL82277.1 Fis family transcriptional regulator [Vitiosangium sp. GDMCC 1.1324]